MCIWCWINTIYFFCMFIFHFLCYFNCLKSIWRTKFRRTISYVKNIRKFISVCVYPEMERMYDQIKTINGPSFISGFFGNHILPNILKIIINWMSCFVKGFQIKIDFIEIAKYYERSMSNLMRCWKTMSHNIWRFYQNKNAQLHCQKQK